VYTSARTFTVRLTVGNAQGQSATVTKPLTVSGTSTQITADFTLSPTDPSASKLQIVFFDASPSTPSAGAAISTYTWDFGDGSAMCLTNGTGCGAGTPQKPQHVFTTANTFVVRLTITDTSSKNATVTHSVTVKP
jgi:PKD repeat protein